MRVLIQSESWRSNGIRTSIVNEVRMLSCPDMEFELLTTWNMADVDDAVLEPYGLVHHKVFDNVRPNLIVRMVNGLRTFGRLLDEGNFDAVHINSSNSTGLLYALVAKHHGVPRRVVHSHNSNFGPGSRGVKAAVQRLCILFCGDAPTDRMACSDVAGRYLFGDKAFETLKNGIELGRFGFDSSVRTSLRAELGVGDRDLLFGNVGRLTEQKNPLGQLRIFAEAAKLRPGARYLFLGEGELLAEAKQLATELGVEESVIFHEPVADAAPYYSALDALLLPSFYEGLPYVCIEAQCSGLPILMSDVVTDEAVVTDLVEKMSLDASAGEWAEKLVELAEMKRDRSVYPESVRAAGFDVESSMERLREILTGE